jgi:chemotaxis protein CheD
MELLINELMKRGAARATLEAKVFGGGQVVAGMDSMDIGEGNIRFVLDYLQTEHIPVVSSDVRGIHPRKVCFLPVSGKAMVKRLAPARGQALIDEERSAARRATSATTGSIELF